MVNKNVYHGAVGTAIAGGVIGILSGSSGLAPWGILGGLIAGWSANTMADGLYDGGLAGLIGGILTLVVIVGVGAINVVLSTGSLNVAGAIGAYVSVVVGLMIIPLFAVEGLVVGSIIPSLRRVLS
ncbi:hypothetical protein ACFFQF_23730 [Haladaptatus pallidirubidus]|uniref:DUF5518 domain-containing protein n=1 Tax=Haladaptatus pallidirubidus TaxID=1008152 RepID=A0AAV3UNH5_9EURY|nr:hypothetical protein [Haladaptatus pallidirubidus]